MGYDDWKTTEPPERDRPTRGQSYVCVDCTWRGREALVHHLDTGHAVRGRTWPASWPNCRFSDSDAVGRRVDMKRA